MQTSCDISVRRFNIGEKFCARCYMPRKPFWCKATILSREGNRIYAVPVAGQGLCERHVDQLLQCTDRDKPHETANDVCYVSVFHPQYPTAISPAPPPDVMPDNKNNALPDSTTSSNTHSCADTSSREGSEPTLTLDADRREAVVADGHSVSVVGIIIDRKDGGEQPESAVAPKPGPSPSTM
ncbi:unnamed protein product [Parnassius apollo]|uniref:(apollo) hypothetical protein n=1 Tax=Parnassius apollo TaxID=110799 RepID=A0A8S3W3A4_PARAO|nr:unnamed protein product [Parnassius apollo]